MEFTLKQKVGEEYIALYPIVDDTALDIDWVGKTIIVVNVPAYGDNQTISVSDITSELANSPFVVYPVSGSEFDYSTISTIQTAEGEIAIRRFFANSGNNITIALVFLTAPTTQGYLSLSGGTLQGTLNMNANSLQNVLTSLMSTDAVNLALANEEIASAVNELKTVAWTITLNAADWDEETQTQTIQDSKFIVDGYVYAVSPASTNVNDYFIRGIYANDVTTDGEMVFNYGNLPVSDLDVVIERIKVG